MRKVTQLPTLLLLCKTVEKTCLLIKSFSSEFQGKKLQSYNKQAVGIKKWLHTFAVLHSFGPFPQQSSFYQLLSYQWHLDHEEISPFHFHLETKLFKMKIQIVNNTNLMKKYWQLQGLISKLQKVIEQLPIHMLAPSYKVRDLRSFS